MDVDELEWESNLPSADGVGPNAAEGTGVEHHVDVDEEEQTVVVCGTSGSAQLERRRPCKVLGTLDDGHVEGAVGVNAPPRRLDQGADLAAGVAAVVGRRRGQHDDQPHVLARQADPFEALDEATKDFDPTG